MLGKKRKSHLPIIIIIVLLIGASIFGYFYFKPDVVVQPKPINNEPVVEKFEIQYEDNTNFVNKLELCSSENTFIKMGSEDVCNKLKVTIKTETDNVEYYFTKNNYFAYSDNGFIKIYDRKLGKSINTQLLIGNYEVRDICISDNGIKGIILKANDYIEFYSIRQSKTIYEKKYKNMNYVIDNYLTVNDSNKALLLSSEEEKVILSQNTNNKDDKYMSIGKNYIGLDYKVNESIHRIAYNLDLKEIDREYDKYTETTDGRLMVSKDNIVYIYNKDGSMNKRIDTYPVILDIVNDYLLIVQNENIYLIDLNDKITDLHIKLRLKDRFKYMSIDGELVIITLLDDYVTSYQVFSYCLSHQDECYYETEDKIKNCSLGYRHIYNIRNGSIKTMPYALCGEQ